MGALNQASLASKRAKLYCAVLDETVPELTSNFSNVATVITAIKELDSQRIASITDLDLAPNTGERVTTDTDDNGTIYNAAVLGAVFRGNWFEQWTPDVLKAFLGLTEVDIAAAGPDKARRIRGQKVEANDLPRIVLWADCEEDADGNKKTAYLLDATFNGEILLSFVDPVRAGGPKSTAFEFTSNKAGAWFVDQEVSAESD